jgi:tRNA (adenine57-N1/adenine58-N1)-methyltransferase catalytic subunit
MVKNKSKSKKVERILVTKHGKKFYVRNLKEDFHSNLGIIKKKDLNKKYGVVKSNKDEEMSIFVPQFIDLYSKIKRAPQIIPRKDLGLIIMETGIGKNSVVVDAGSGSGALCSALGNIVKKVVSYEIREDFYKIAKDNIKMLGLSNVKIKNKDVILGIDEKNVDLVTLDMPNPWDVVQSVRGALRTGGFLVSYSPTVPQVMDFVKTVRKCSGLVYLKTVEVSEREWEVDERKVRPKSQQIGHSGFISFIRKV